MTFYIDVEKLLMEYNTNKTTNIMKKLILFLALNCVVCTLQAQLRVNQNGNVSIGTTAVPLSPLSVASVGNADYNMYARSGKHVK